MPTCKQQHDTTNPTNLLPHRHPCMERHGLERSPKRQPALLDSTMFRIYCVSVLEDRVAGT